MEKDSLSSNELPEGAQKFSPHGEALGIRFEAMDGQALIICVPYAEHLVGDPDTGVIHGGVITAAMDNASGWSIRVRDDHDPEMSMATLDLRIDYMKPATPGEDLMIRAECYKQTQNIAFVRAVAYHDSVDDPVATSTAAFMKGTPNAPRQ